MILVYKYRIKDRSAHKVLKQYAAACNQVWNYCNALQRDVESRYRAGSPSRRWPSGFDFCKLTRGVSQELGIYAQTVNAVCLQYAVSRDKRRHSGKFRSSAGSKRSLGWVPFTKQNQIIEGNSILYLGKRFRWFGNKRRPLPTAAFGGCFVEDAKGHWYVCFRVEAPGREYGTANLGIDLGLKTLVTISDGRKIDAPQFYRSLEAQLSTAKRAGNKKRARAIGIKIRNKRRDFLHKLSNSIVAESSLVAVGDISSVRLAKTSRAKSMYDAGWSIFRAQLRYKCQQAGVVYLDVDEDFTTQTCSCCGALPDGRPKGIAGLGIREWGCSECGSVHDRDVNAAKNILKLALSAQRPVGESQESDRHAGPYRTQTESPWRQQCDSI